MMVDARREGPTAPFACDVCIIGAGAAGITLALELAHPGRTICVLEGGGAGYERAAQSLLEGDEASAGYPPLHTARLAAFGGSTGVWGGWSRPLDNIDYEHRSGIPCSGWPIGPADLAPFYVQANERLQLGAFEYDPTAWGRSAGVQPLSLAQFDIDSLLLRQSPVKFGRTFRAALAASRDTRVYLHAPVTRLLYSANGTSVTAIECRTLSGREFRILPRVTVLAAGGIENARLLLISAMANDRGPGNARGRVGRYFTDHGYIDAAIFRPADRTHPLAFYQRQLAGRKTNPAIARGALCVSPQRQRREGLLNSAMFFRPAYESDAVFEQPGVQGMLYAWDMLMHKAVPDRMLGRLLSGARMPRTLATAIYRRVAGASVAPARWRMRTLFECAVDPDNRIELGHARDAVGRQKVRLVWKMAEDDLASVARSHGILDNALRVAGLGQLQMIAESAAALLPLAEAAKHHMATTRMHDDPAQGVVNRDCRLHDVDNLFVAGSSVFTTGGFANPTLTVIALTLRLAAHLNSRVLD